MGEDWADVMERVTQIDLPWTQIVSIIVHKDDICYKVKTFRGTSCSICYNDFLRVEHIRRKSRAFRTAEKRKVLKCAYTDRNYLLFIYDFFDTNKDGGIHMSEFYYGYQKLNRSRRKKLPGNPAEMFHFLG